MNKISQQSVENQNKPLDLNPYFIKNGQVVLQHNENLKINKLNNEQEPLSFEEYEISITRQHQLLNKEADLKQRETKIAEQEKIIEQQKLELQNALASLKMQQQRIYLKQNHELKRQTFFASKTNRSDRIRQEPPESMHQALANNAIKTTEFVQMKTKKHSFEEKMKKVKMMLIERQEESQMSSEEEEDHFMQQYGYPHEADIHCQDDFGLTEEEMAKLPIRIYCSAEREDQCSICMADFREEQSLIVLRKCSHLFHQACIREWLKNRNKCPLCKQNQIEFY